MANFSFGARTVCPYYIREYKISLTCEGFIQGTCCVTRFADEAAKIKYQANVCECYDYLSRCKIAAAVHEKYKEEP